MTNEELKQAFMEQCPVSLKMPFGDEIEYAYVYEIAYRLIDGKIAVYGVLMDRNNNSVTRARAKDIRRI